MLLVPLCTQIDGKIDHEFESYELFLSTDQVSSERGPRLLSLASRGTKLTVHLV